MSIWLFCVCEKTTTTTRLKIPVCKMLYVRVQFYFICLLLPFKMYPRELFYLCRSSGGKIVLKNKLIQMCKRNTQTRTRSVQTFKAIDVHNFVYT